MKIGNRDFEVETLITISIDDLTEDTNLIFTFNGVNNGSDSEH